MKVSLEIQPPNWVWDKEWWARRPWKLEKNGWDGHAHRWTRKTWTNGRWLMERADCDCGAVDFRTVRRLW